MRRLLAAASVLLGFVLLSAGESRAGEPASDELQIEIDAGKYDRRDALVSTRLPAKTLAHLAPALDRGPVALKLRDGGETIVAEALISPDDPESVTLRWIQPGPIASGSKKTLSLDVRAAEPFRSPWSFEKTTSGALDLKHGSQPVFRYNAVPVLAPGLPEIQRRDAYLHPVYTPSGVLATGDFSKFHTHHRGIFLAYAKMKVKGEVVDVWNIHNAAIGGKVHHRSMSKPSTGPLSAEFSVSNRWENKRKEPFLDETWKVVVYDVPGSPYWLFDITSTQTALDSPVELTPYRYGGMAYRGPEPFVKGKLDVLTSQGFGRVDGDQKPARWVDLTGPISDGSTLYAGAMIADHPSNINHPTVARIHPTSLPFFSYVPAHEKHNKPVIIPPRQSLTFRYRVLVHDGHPSVDLDERIWRDFAEAVTAKVVTPKTEGQ